MSSPGTNFSTNTPVVVNLDVLVDASGNIEVFGQTPPSVSNVIVANTTLPVAALYDASGASNGGTTNSLFEFWEPSSDIGSRLATKCQTGSRNYTKMTKKFVRDMQLILEGSFDCSAATPFNEIMYAGNSSYTTQENFGRLALSTYAHHLFGHVAATSAITNDLAFMNAMLSKGAGETGSVVDASGVAGDASGNEWVAPTIGSIANADLARLIVGAIVTKNDPAILAIVEQVLGQDASRAMDQDNNVIAPDIRQPLKFIAGDVIYVNIRLQRPSVTVLSGQKITQQTLEGKYDTNENYTLKITLENKAGTPFPPA